MPSNTVLYKYAIEIFGYCQMCCTSTLLTKHLLNLFIEQSIHCDRLLPCAVNQKGEALTYPHSPLPVKRYRHACLLKVV